MISGRASVEELLPGDSAAIGSAIEMVGHSVSASGSISNAWQQMVLPGWQGKAGAKWAQFVPMEASASGQAEKAFRKVTSALTTYQQAFNQARSDLADAIEMARQAQLATEASRQEHESALLDAKDATPGSAAADVLDFVDKGSGLLAEADLKATNAIKAFKDVAAETANQIRSVAAIGSDYDSEISASDKAVWDQIVQFPGRFVEGAILQLTDTLVGVWEMTPLPYMLDNIFNPSSKPWWDAYFGDLWGGIISTIIEDPLSIAPAIWNDFIAADHWDQYAGEGVGRVSMNVLMLAAGGAGIVKALKGLKTARDLKMLKAADEAAKRADEVKPPTILKDGEQWISKGKLKPNITYTTGEFDYVYTTDANGFISSFRADKLQLTAREDRLRHDPNTLGKQPDDHAGHLAADQFGGSPELDNLVSQLSSVNLSRYRKIEIKWAKALDPTQPGGPKHVSVEVKTINDPATGRPIKFDVTWSIDGDRKFISIPNN